MVGIIGFGFVIATQFLNAYLTRRARRQAVCTAVLTELKMFRRAFEATGNYRGFVLNAYAMNASRTGRDTESVECFARMVEIYLGYNEPYMIKVALNGLAKLVPGRKLKGLDVLRSAGLVDNDFKPHNEVSFLVSSAVDLENPLMGGLEQAIFGNRSSSELHEYTKTERGLNAAFKSYGQWRFISSLRTANAK